MIYYEYYKTDDMIENICKLIYSIFVKLLDAI